MLEAVVKAAVGAMKAAGIKAFEAYPMSPVQRGAGTFVCAGIKSAERTDAGFAGYLGTQTDENGEIREVYGMRCDIVLELEIYAPISAGQEECIRCFDSAVEALDSLAAGLKIRGMVCGEAVPDPKTGMLRCACQIHAAALLTATEGGETGEFTDFALKGVLNK